MNLYSPSTWSQRLIFTAIIAGFIDVLLILAGANQSFHAMLAPVVGVLVITAAGELLLNFAGLAALAVLPAAFVTGAAVMMMATLGFIELLDVTAQTGFLLCTAVVALVYLAFPKRRLARNTSWIDIVSTLILVILIGYFCKDIAAFVPSASAGGPLPVWTDYYVHGTVIASFGDPLAIKEGNILLAQVPRPFYHYGSFMLPASLLPSTGLSGFALSLATLLPLGLLIGAMGLYVLAAELSGRAIALLAILCIACLPDASYYAMQNGFYGFRWLLYTAPGSGYALGVATLATTCLVQGIRTKGRAKNLLGLFLLLSLFMIRFHFFVLLAPAFAGTWLIAQWRISAARKAQLVAGGFALVFAASISILATQTGLRTTLQPLQYAETALNFGPAGYSQFFHHLELSTPLAIPLVAAVTMMMVATLGIFILGLPITTLAWARSGRWEDADWLPWMLCGAYALLILLAPTGLNTDASELKHRHFILLYAVVGTWTIVRAMQWLPLRSMESDRLEYALLGTSAAILLLTLIFGRNVNPGKPSLVHMPWANSFFGVPVAPGIAQAGAYIREHSERGDLMLMSGEAMRGYIQSRQTELIGFADVATYLGRTELLEKQGGTASYLANKRGAEINAVVTADSWTAACHLMNQMGVRWYIENQRHSPKWDPTQSISSFKAGDFAVYDAGSRQRSRCGKAEH